MPELFPDEMAVATFFYMNAPWCWVCGGFGLYSDQHDRWHQCSHILEPGHGRYLPKGRWRQDA